MGFPLGLSGQDLADRAVAQAEKFGARMVVSSCAVGMTCAKDGIHTLDVDGFGKLETRSVILATGATYRKLEVDNLEAFENRGVYYSATHIERILCSDDAVIVVGGGNSAGQAAIFMSQGTLKVYLVVRSNDLRKNMSAYLAKRIEQSDRIQILLNSEVCSIDGSNHLERVVIADKRSGKKLNLEAGAVFVMVGADPRTAWLPSKIAKDDKGFILTGSELVTSGIWTEKRQPYFLETSCPGVFAVGDARSGSVKRVASAVGEGSMAVSFVHQYLSL
jgi:thioredoxin reductase (NADPH)